MSDPRAVITAEDVYAVAPGDELVVPPGSHVTPWARELAASRGVRLHEGPANGPGNVVALGADHGGFQVKEDLKPHLARLGLRVTLYVQAPGSGHQPDAAHERAVDERAEHCGLAVGRESRLRDRERLRDVLLETRREGLRVLGEAREPQLAVGGRVGRDEPPDDRFR